MVRIHESAVVAIDGRAIDQQIVAALGANLHQRNDFGHCSQSISTDAGHLKIAREKGLGGWTTGYQSRGRLSPRTSGAM
jgi:hypothetical protein